MARYTGPVCRLCRREGEKLYLKGERCGSAACAIARRSYAPGQHGSANLKKKKSEYCLQLREKQKVRRVYGVLERQFRNYFKKANKIKGVTGDNLLSMLEKRLDNVVYRLGFARSRTEARQIVRHGYIKVNGAKVDIPSYIVKCNDIIEVKLNNNTEEPLERFKLISAATNLQTVPQWLSVDGLKGTVISEPDATLQSSLFNMTLVIEFYSR
jgi:small subunit ribosomal protein S4